MNRISLFLKGNVPSKKSSQIMIPKLRRLIPNERYRKWHKYCEEQLNEEVLSWWKSPDNNLATIKMYFLRESRRHWDYINAAQSVMDLLVDVKMFVDDDADHILPVFEGYEYNKDNPGVALDISW